MTTGLIVCAAVLVAATLFGLWRRRTDGEIRDLPVRPVADDAPPVNLRSASRAEHGGEVLSEEILGASLGTRATLVQFSTAFCQPCRATRRILDEVAGMVDGTAHVEIDAEAHLDLVRRLDIRRTPTVLILDGSGAIVKRASGLPRKADVIAALGEIIS
jgi:thiol-disulfide isomerase/thioredoxin